MAHPLHFESRAAFRQWLTQNARSSEGVWLLFGKSSRLVTVKANEALEEALCFSWIDGQMKRLDEHSYIKYFSERRKNSKWSQKNKALAQSLEKRGLMTEAGREKVLEAKQNGQWAAATKPSAVSQQHIDQLADLLQSNPLAHTNFLNMSPSVKKTYTRAYLDAKTDTGRAKRIAWITERLDKNLKPM